MKCDIEGAELLHACAGGHDLFRSPTAPILIAEANRDASRALGYRSSEIPQFLAALTEADYLIFVEEHPTRWVRTTEFPELQQYILAVPAARLDRWPGLAESRVISIDDAGTATLS